MNRGPSRTQYEQEDRPTRRTLCGVLRRSTNWKCLILTFLITGCLGAIGWCRNTQVTKILLNFDAFPITSTRQVSPCDEGYLYIPTAFVIMLYLLYLVECWHSKARIQLSLKKTDVNRVYSSIRQMREATPIVWWKAICYHYVRRHRQITRYRNGGAYTSSQVFYERVNSAAVASYFYHTACGLRDISKPPNGLEDHLATRITFSKAFIFANLPTATEFEEQRSAFFQESVVAWTRPEALPWFARYHLFWIFSFLLLSWPIRILLELNTAHLHYKITKLFGVNYPSNPSLHEHQRPLLYSDYLTHMQEGRRGRLGGARAPRTPRPSPRTSGPPQSLLPAPSPSPPTSPKKGGTEYFAGALPRSVTLTLQPDLFCLYDKRDFCSSNSSLTSSLIPTYAQALLLLNGPIGRDNSNGSSPLEGPGPGPHPDNDGRSDPNQFTGIEIDLTEPVVSGDAPPPSYLEALRTSRPVFLPAFTRLRRCLTERDISGRRNRLDSDRERLQTWINYVSPSFLDRFRLPFSVRNSTTNILSGRSADKAGCEESSL